MQIRQVSPMVEFVEALYTNAAVELGHDNWRIALLPPPQGRVVITYRPEVEGLLLRSGRELRQYSWAVEKIAEMGTYADANYIDAEIKRVIESLKDGTGA